MRVSMSEAQFGTHNCMKTPSPNGRTARGQFARGNPGGPGNPHAKRVAELREALLSSINPNDIRDIVHALVSRAKSGEVAAIRELLDRLLGRSGDTGGQGTNPMVINVVTGVPQCHDAQARCS